ncbi:hypothetical protein VE01_06521 [Pseudogymnoascus verrucosus]|uniref:Zn(2)-C6 fungal-type domain-containing protein n=1 Tax=Pseudogymnoascus verrucosus TaxID=342668 RepID=A0A1B8GIY7_9PEZI|nr:uncharacterized protein VE01_06521 [Pseudogymnoascus verrucosus]OBT95775.1 hypothetical protein VE01_06521 [Pseudogymnoascus verrucosus]
MTSITRTRTSCESCRRRRKKCDEGKPRCAACVRLGIHCEISRPGFEFVNDTTSTFKDETQNRRRFRRKAQPLTSHHALVDDRDNDGGSNISQTSVLVADNEEYVAFLQSPLIKGGKGSEHATRYSIYSAESPTTRRHHALNLTNISTSTDDSPRATPSGVVDGSAPDLTAWFSCFVDFSPSVASTVANDPPTRVEVDDRFHEMQEVLYIHHWHTHLLETLPVQFKQVESLTDGCTALRPAIIALSACDLAQARTDVSSWTIEHEKRWLFSPNKDHQNYGRMYYNVAKRELATADYSKQEPTAVLAILMLFVYIESHIGSFRGAAFHHHGIEHLLSSRHDFCDQSALTRDLVRSWTSLRAQNWKHRIPFTVLDFQKSLLDLGLSVEQLLDPSEARDEAVIVNMLQSWRLSLMVLFERYTGRGDMESISSRCCRDYYERINLLEVTQPWRPKVPIPDEDYEALLREQRTELDRWYAALPPSHLPNESFRSKSNAWDPLQLGQPPLQFASHQAAMNYVYYAAARIFQSRENIEEFLALPPLSPHHLAQLDPPGVNHWLLVLLRTISSLDLGACARHSSYSVGILEILHMCHLRLPRCSQIVQSGVHYMITAYTNNCITHEGSGLILGFQHVFEEIEEQRNLGRDLFYIIPRSSPDSQRQLAYDDANPSVVYGRDRATGKFFCQLLSPRRKVH